MTTQVLVAGWGAAGACTALEAKSHGLDVIVADRFMGGGASAKSGGVVYAGGGTAQQADAGVNDSPEAMYEYLRHETCGVISDDTLWDFAAAVGRICAGLNPSGFLLPPPCHPEGRLPIQLMDITCITQAMS